VTWTHDESGTPTSHAAYDPFGNLITGSTTLSATRWQSSYQDTASGLYYVIARWYAPTLGRFLSDDPLGGDAANPDSRDPYAYGDGDSVDHTDPTGECNADHENCPVMLDTSVVGRFHEPSTKTDPDNYDLCGPGALRVTLAFVSTNTFYDERGGKKIAYQVHGRKKHWGTLDIWNGKWAHADTGGGVVYGQDYMLYLAYGVTAYGVWHAGEVHGDGAGGVSSTAADMAAVANWEFAGERKAHARFFAMYASGHHPASYGTFQKNVQYSIAVGVPMMVAARTASLTNADVGLPSWALQQGDKPNQLLCTSDNPKKPSTECTGLGNSEWSNFYSLYPKGDIGHWISIVGYDNDNYYYLDTCPRGDKFAHGGTIKCRVEGPEDDDEVNLHQGLTIPHVWMISKDDLWQLISKWPGGAWIRYTGAPVHTHNPW
jgi:RHS repeat-associated protein